MTARRAASVQLGLIPTGRSLLRRHGGRLTVAPDIAGAGGVAPETVMAQLRSRR